MSIQQRKSKRQKKERNSWLLNRLIIFIILMQLCIKHLLIGEVLFVFSLSGPVKCVQKKKKKNYRHFHRNHCNISVFVCLFHMLAKHLNKNPDPVSLCVEMKDFPPWYLYFYRSVCHMRLFYLVLCWYLSFFVSVLVARACPTPYEVGSQPSSHVLGGGAPVWSVNDISVA